MRKCLKLCIAGIFLCLSVLCNTVLADYNDVESPFPDVPADANYAEAVSVLYQLQIFTGDDKGNFNPDKTITRAETAKVMCVLMGAGDEAASMKKQVYSDVPASHWAAGYIAKASELGVINGIGENKFGPNDPVTYEQIITMLVRAWGWDGLAEEAGGWPNGYLQVGEDSGYTKGVVFNPKDAATRSAVALLIYNSMY